MSRLRSRSFVLSLLVCTTLSVSACSTVAGWFGKDESDRNRQSFGSRRAPSANPDGAGMGEAYKAPSTDTASDNPYDQYNGSGARVASASQASSSSGVMGGNFFSRASATPNAAQGERRRPVENAPADMGFAAPTEMAAPVTPLDSSAPTRTAPANYAAVEPLPPYVEPTAKPAKAVKAESKKVTAETKVAAKAELPRELPREPIVAAPNDAYPVLADTPEVPARMEEFRKSRESAKAEMAALKNEHARAQDERFALMSETGTAAGLDVPPSADKIAPVEAARPAALPEPKGKDKDKDKGKSKRNAEALNEQELASIVNEPAPVVERTVPAATPAREGNWFSRTFGWGDDDMNAHSRPPEPVRAPVEIVAAEPLPEALPDEKPMRNVEAVREDKPIILTEPAPEFKPESVPEFKPAREEKMAVAPVAEEEPIVLRPPPGVAGVPDEPANLDDYKPATYAAAPAGIMLQEPKAIAQTRFLGESRYAARRMANREHATRGSY